MATHPLHLAAALSEAAPAVRGDCFAAFQQEFDYLCRTLRRLGVRPPDVEDLAHEVFLVLYRRWDDFDPSRPLRPWLFGIAFRVASSHHKSRARELPHGTLDVEDAASEAEQVLEAEEARALVLAALDRLPLARRGVLVMHDIDGVAMRDVASVLSIPLFTAYSRLRKARKEFELAASLLRKRGARS